MSGTAQEAKDATRVQIPRALTRSLPRRVRLTAGGRAAAGMAIALAIAAFVVPYVILAERMESRAFGERLEREVVWTDAEIVSLSRGEGKERIARYRYFVNGAEYRGRVRLRRSEPAKVGGALRILYTPNDPALHQIEGQEQREAPLALIPVVGMAFLIGAGAIARELRRNLRMAAEGKVAIARVTGHTRQRHQHGAGHNVQFEYELRNGARRQGNFGVGKSPPPIGSELLVVYDRHNPKFVRRLPLQLAEAV